MKRQKKQLKRALKISIQKVKITKADGGLKISWVKSPRTEDKYYKIVASKSNNAPAILKTDILIMYQMLVQLPT